MSEQERQGIGIIVKIPPPKKKGYTIPTRPKVYRFGLRDKQKETKETKEKRKEK